jgi:short-subunit dehydrogenase
VSATCVHPGGIKTNIAKSSRDDGTMGTLGRVGGEATKKKFEETFFRTTADEAAETILRGVRRNARRVLIGKDAHAIDIVQRLLPARYQWIVVQRARKFLGAEA